MRVLITAGPTREPIDPVRYISNRSSGLMGRALVDAAAVNASHSATLILGPSAIAAPTMSCMFGNAAKGIAEVQTDGKLNLPQEMDLSP